VLFSFGVPEENLRGDADGGDEDCELLTTVLGYVRDGHENQQFRALFCYPLVNVYIAIENHHFNR